MTWYQSHFNVSFCYFNVSLRKFKIACLVHSFGMQYHSIGTKMLKVFLLMTEKSTVIFMSYFEQHTFVISEYSFHI